MNEQTDAQLLRAYAERRSEPAFAELVRRYVDLVHSAARRMVCDAHLAEDVTQGAFVALAKNAAQLTNCPVLSGWLHRTAQNIAAQTVRTDVRRRAREQEAAAMNELLSAEPDAPWEHIAPHLDAALGELSDAERDVLLLRYFERKSARDMAQTLGISDEAAQKRVNRAVERLREFFAKRGVTVGVGALVGLISTNAVQSAPVGLAVSVSTATALAGTAVSTSTVIAATKTLAMTTLRKILITATITVAVGTGVYEARQTSNLRRQVQALQQQQAPLTGQIQNLHRERDELMNRLTTLVDGVKAVKGDSSELLRLRSKITLLQNAAGDPSDIAAKDLVARVTRLKQRLEQIPGAKIPELQLLNEQDWLTASRGWNLNSEGDFRKALSGLRGIAEQTFANKAQGALAKFSQANGGAFPTELSQVQPYFDSPVDAAILQRWEILPAGATIPGIGNEGPFITQKAAVDDLLDRRFAVTLNGFAATDFLNSQIQPALTPVYQAYAAANHGVYAGDPSEYLPFAATPEQQAAVQRLLEQAAARK